MAQNSSSDLVERIRSSVDIYDLIKEYVPGLKRSGSNYKAQCPFHQEKTPSFVVSPDKGIFHCFGCGAGGDIFKFVMDIDRLDFKEALLKLGQRAGIDPKEFSKKEDFKEVFETRKYYKLLEDAKVFYHEKLLSGAGVRVRGYLAQRGLSPASIESFELGLSTQSGNDLLEWCSKKGYGPEMLQKAGLAVYDTTRKKFRDYFWNRIMFPILDSQGRTVAFGARIIDKGEPKFLNSADSFLFSKSRILYGLHQGSDELRKKKSIVLLEGYLDVIMAHQAGVRNAAASMGTALTPDQIKLLSRYATDVILAYDPDEAGRLASIRSAELLIDSDFFPRIATFPDGLDADDVILKKGAEVFSGILAAAEEAVVFKITVLLNSIAPRSINDISSSDRIHLINDCLGLVKRIRDSVYQAEALKLAGEKLGVDERTLRQELDRLGGKKFRSNSPKTVQPDQEIITVEFEILGLLFQYPQCIGEQIITENDFEDEKYRKIFKACVRVAKGHKGDKNFAAAVLEQLDDEGLERLVRRIVARDVAYDDAGEVLKRMTNDMRLKLLKARHGMLAAQVSGMLDGKTVRQADVINEYNELTQRLKGYKK